MMAADGRVSVQAAQDAIYRALTQDFTYGRRKDGVPLKRPYHNQALFDATEGWAVFHGTDLEMVMAAVEVGLLLAAEQERAATDAVKGE
jgi:hypothetical protein